MKYQNPKGITPHAPACVYRKLLPFFFYTFVIPICVVLTPAVLSGQDRKPSSENINPEVRQRVKETLKKNFLTLTLTENNNQQGLSPDVLAYFSSANEMVFIEKDRLRIVVLEKKERDSGSRDENKERVPSAKNNYRYNSFTIHFKNSKGVAGIEKEKPFRFKTNFISSGKHTRSGSYGEITLKQVYPGIDLRLYSQQSGQLEFDWITWPGADPSAIQMEFEGQKDLRVSGSGALQVQLVMGFFHINLPESYYVTPEGKRKADIKFNIQNGNLVHFSGFRKNKSKYPLVIDPDLLWGSYFDGGNSSFDEYLYAIDFDENSQLLYCAGAANVQVSAVYAAALSSAYDSTFYAKPDVLVYALTKNGELLQHITYIGGDSTDVAIGLSVKDSFVYVCGYTLSANYPVTKAADGNWPAFDSLYHAKKDGFISVLGLTLDSLHYSSFLGGDGNDMALTVRAVSDSIYYVSLTSEDTLPVSSPNYIYNYADSIFDGNSEAWIGKFSSFNTMDFGTYIGGTDDDLVNDFHVLSDGDVIFTGNTSQIAEVNATIPDNGTGQEVLFGRIDVPASGPVSFPFIDKIGGSNNDMGWGLLCLADSVSIITGQTNSNDFPLGGGTTFQSVRNGNYDGFIARMNSDGSGGYKASFVGGSGSDILVSVRPVNANGTALLLGFGTTDSNDLPTVNSDGGTLYSASNSGGKDMMFLICNLSLSTKYYLSYLGGNQNDYLGATGAPLGSNHLYFNQPDSVLYLGTTTHSQQTTINPVYIGRGIDDYLNAGVPVFDDTKGNSTDDVHTIIAISTHRLFTILPMKWVGFNGSVDNNCIVNLHWETDNEINLQKMVVERSTDGRNYEVVSDLAAGQNIYHFEDGVLPSSAPGRLYYRIKALEFDGSYSYSPVTSLMPCGAGQKTISIYPTITSNTITITGLQQFNGRSMVMELVNTGGANVFTKTLVPSSPVQVINFENRLNTGAYVVLIKEKGTDKILKTQKIIIHK